MRRRVMETFAQIDPSGQVGEECWSDYRQKLARWQGGAGRLAQFLDGWARHRAALQELSRPPERLAQILRAIGAPLHFAELEPPVESGDVRFAFMNAPLMRKRLTLGDILMYFDWDRERLWEEIRAEGWGVR